MSIQTSTQGLTDFLQRNDKLIQDIRETGKDVTDQVKGLATRFDQARNEAQELISKLGTASFVVAKANDTKVKQARLFEEITVIGKKISDYQDHPEITAGLYATQAAKYVALANTFNDTVSQFVTFTDDEVAQLQTLLRGATLDAEARQRWADILDATVQLTKLALKVAAKLATV
jgi:hypothetical protein